MSSTMAHKDPPILKSIPKTEYKTTFAICSHKISKSFLGTPFYSRFEIFVHDLE